MPDALKNYWPIMISAVTIVVSIATQWAIFGSRLAAVESRQDRQGTAISALQDATTQQQANYAALSAKLDALSDNVSYIRSRIDNALK